MKFRTKLWKRSNKSFASTIPHIVLLSMNENKDHEVIWEYDAKINKWTFSLEESNKNQKDAKKLNKKQKDKNSGGVPDGK